MVVSEYQFLASNEVVAGSIPARRRKVPVAQW